MKRKAILGLAVLASILVAIPSPVIGWDPASSHDRASAEAFAGGHMTKTAMPPFAFLYGGRQAQPLLGKWDIAAEDKIDGAKLVRTVVYTDPSTGLRVTAVYTIYKDFPAVEWVVRFKNTGRADTPVIENVRACAVSFPDFAAGPSAPAPASGPAPAP